MNYANNEEMKIQTHGKENKMIIINRTQNNYQDWLDVCLVFKGEVAICETKQEEKII